LGEVERCWVDLHIDFYDDILSRARYCFLFAN
jgi:hypothetical protein